MKLAEYVDLINLHVGRGDFKAVGVLDRHALCYLTRAEYNAMLPLLIGAYQQTTRGQADLLFAQPWNRQRISTGTIAPLTEGEWNRNRRQCGSGTGATLQWGGAQYKKGPQLNGYGTSEPPPLRTNGDAEKRPDEQKAATAEPAPESTLVYWIGGALLAGALLFGSVLARGGTGASRKKGR